MIVLKIIIDEDMIKNGEIVNDIKIWWSWTTQLKLEAFVYPLILVWSFKWSFMSFV
jgi:hypothetical protein